jgi:hypothetical protein
MIDQRWESKLASRGTRIRVVRVDWRSNGLCGKGPKTLQPAIRATFSRPEIQGRAVRGIAHKLDRGGVVRGSHVWVAVVAAALSN